MHRYMEINVNNNDKILKQEFRWKIRFPGELGMATDILFRTYLFHHPWPFFFKSNVNNNDDKIKVLMITIVMVITRMTLTLTTMMTMIMMMIVIITTFYLYVQLYLCQNLLFHRLLTQMLLCKPLLLDLRRLNWLEDRQYTSLSIGEDSYKR